ncbi:hypothetical protein L2Z53_12055 (plasmid) [Macrococcoides canis]|uniref:hypothetical protein n=1 Tax=Macrococcoides canis TaxID=1855823 RepID=UPI001F24E29A|nr:hypothetical protein [Macrococcus canis]UJS28987.1 hypothetical protein L2Z53_12055 [Macrococcus canis]
MKNIKMWVLFESIQIIFLIAGCIDIYFYNLELDFDYNNPIIESLRVVEYEGYIEKLIYGIILIVLSLLFLFYLYKEFNVIETWIKWIKILFIISNILLLIIFVIIFASPILYSLFVIGTISLLAVTYSGSN